jgi:hypothetical protein
MTSTDQTCIAALATALGVSAEPTETAADLIAFAKMQARSFRRIAAQFRKIGNADMADRYARWADEWEEAFPDPMQFALAAQ